MKRALSSRAPLLGGLLDPGGGAVQSGVSEHCFSKYDQKLFTRKNTGVEVKSVELIGHGKRELKGCLSRHWAFLQREETG